MSQNGLLLVNLGSPASPRPKDVKAYLKEFLSDQNVVTLPKWFWQPLLRGIILPMRTWRSATFYQHMWTQAGSPLTVYTKMMTQKVQQRLTTWDVQYAMNYGGPTIAEKLKSMHQKGDRQILVLPLFPNYTQSTHDTIIEKVKVTGVPARIIKNFYDQPTYQKLLARQVDECYVKGDYDAVIFSYHGIPMSMIHNGDPYEKECKATTEATAKYLQQVPRNKIMTVFQSKFGPMPWLKPYLKNTLMELAAMGKRNVLIVTPSFVEDCLETLEENDVQNYQTFRSSGGKVFDAVPPMNASDDFCEFIAELSRQKLAVNWGACR
ncbi:ferrochelatase [Lentilactobacillus fungorum]|uniref:Coproporphyrin III ferrochelatase n=1 Tax=Lentilactobacillus fungorum TaxID=2201250 RepID=A0ABQ3VZV8_9LACO|nr:ferrochelatase [Lentilactobacillus fungorum]GHP13842.1 ferrochelatase [Lentilactobacillus fungorum]